MMASGVEVYQKIIDDAAVDPAAEIKYELAPCEQGSLKMLNHHMPWSIAPIEFEYMYDFIRRHNLRRGYECATAFGVSSLCFALAMKLTGGKLATVDAYIEEVHDHCEGYRDVVQVNSGSPDGLKSAQWLFKHFDVDDVVTPFIGWSPFDVPATINRVFGWNEKLDFAFIDAGHWDAACMRDIASIVPFIDISKPYAIFLHDSQRFTGVTWGMCRTIFEREPVNLGPMFSTPSFNLACITNLQI